MILSLLTPGARRRSGAPWVVALLLAALTVLAGCSAPARPAAQPAPDPFRTAFLTDNGLLSVPELWKALGPSTTAGLLRHLALNAAGRPSVWRQSPRQTFDALREESDPIEAAGLIVDAGLDARGLWSAADVRRWWRTAVAEGDIDHQAVIVRLAAEPQRLPVDRADLDAWHGLLAAPDAVPAELAADLLAVFEPTAERRPNSATINFRTPRDAAAYLLHAAVAEHRSPDAANPEILTIARAAVPRDDWAMYDLARAYAVSGRPQDASAVVDAMDPRRLVGPDTVLEVPQFEGTVGSTFRMVRTLAAQGRLAEIDPALTRDLVDRTRSLLNTDVSHRVAGLALIALLEPGTVPAADATQAVTDALAAAGVHGRLSNPKLAIGWTSVAEYAQVLGVPLTFPGITAAAVHAWTAAKEPLAGVSISRFLLAVDGSSAPTSSRLLNRLVARVRLTLAVPAKAESIALFAGLLAIRRVSGDWAVDVRRVREQSAARDGGCLGAFDGFVRDLPRVGAACDTDATWFATLVHDALDR